MHGATSVGVLMMFGAVRHRTVVAGGIEVFYRESGPATDPALLLLHGFPTSSHMFRRLMSRLGDSVHCIAPDLPGFGHTESPSPASFDYTFENSPRS